MGDVASLVFIVMKLIDFWFYLHQFQIRTCMKYLFNIPLYLFLFTGLYGFGQRIDTVVNKVAYRSFYSYACKTPLYTVCYLFQGGGECSRSGLKFRKEYKTADNKDYLRSGYQRGHLVNAEDFAYDCTKLKSTFSYYNCIPQHPKLNQGSWKSWENTIRKESQRYPLKMYAGVIYGTKTIGKGVRIPTHCWKVVYNTNTKLILHALLFNNDATEKVERITIGKLQQLLGYPVEFNAL